MDLPQFPIEGGCVCGRVRYRLKAAPLTVYRCHCKDCQRTSGAAYSMSAIVPIENVELLRGELVAYDKTADSGRHMDMMRCRNCGTLIWNAAPGGGGILVLKPGTLDDMGWAEPVGNIWTASKAAWMQIEPDAVNYPGQATPNRDRLIAAWDERHRA